MSEDNVGYENIDMEKTGKRIQELSMRAGYSVKDIQKFLHLSCPQPVYRWMKGSILPSVNHLYMLSRLFRVHMEELLVVSNGWEQLDYSETAKMRYQRISGYWSRIVAA